MRHIAVTLGGDARAAAHQRARTPAPAAPSRASALYFADAGQHLEHRLFVDHDAPHCTQPTSNTRAPCRATAPTPVWVGDVLIRAGAEGTQTYEINRNLVLTEGARADSVPNLEIETGQIRGAGHAAATGRFDDEQLFYLPGARHPRSGGPTTRRPRLLRRHHRQDPRRRGPGPPDPGCRAGARATTAYATPEV
ncbi:MAG: SufD family Fe-S cluster assembly protein [Dermatophilaceae bacterium]